MKTKYFKYLWFCSYPWLICFSMFTIRMKTKTDIQDRIYQNGKTLRSQKRQRSICQNY